VAEGGRTHHREGSKRVISSRKWALLTWLVSGLGITLLLQVMFDYSLLVSALIAFGFGLIPVVPDLLKKKG